MRCVIHVLFGVSQRALYLYSCASCGWCLCLIPRSFSLVHTTRYVKIIDRRLGTVWEFPCGRRVLRGDGHVSLRQSAVQAHATDPDQAGDLVAYEVSTVTSNLFGAGTDAHVFVTLSGKRDGIATTSGKREMSKSETHRDKFERGHEDVFKIEAIDLGKLEKVRIEHDASGWKVSSVVMSAARALCVYFSTRASAREGHVDVYRA